MVKSPSSYARSPWILKTNQLFVKNTTCRFGCQQIDYLEHVILENSIPVDPRKVNVMSTWLFPSSPKALILELIGYYQKFVKAYGSIDTPLNTMLKGEFKENVESRDAFERLKQALLSSSVLWMPNFNLGVIVECECIKHLSGNRSNLAYSSQSLKERALAFSMYEKEMMAILVRPDGRRFIIKTNQKSIKFLLDQKYWEESQHPWV